MENDIIDSLTDIGYEGPMKDDDALDAALNGGPKSLEYTKLIHVLAEELKQRCNLEEQITMMQHPDDSSSFLLELSSFLKEIGCPYKRMVSGPMSSRLQTREDRILLLDYLLSEVMSARMVHVDKPVEKDDSMKIVVQESSVARDLKNILITLKFNKPPPNITCELLFEKVYVKLKEIIDKEGPDYLGRPLYNKALTAEQWRQLEQRFVDMQEEYRLRKEMLITRLECTVQSFQWSDRLKDKTEQIQAAFRPKRAVMKVKPEVRLGDFLAARTNLLHVEKTSSAAVRKNTTSQVNKVIIGKVPDRGGRPADQQPPPPEMPSWQQRQPGGGGRGGGGGGNRGGRGGGGGDRGGRGGGSRVQGGWNDQNRSQPQQSYDYQNNRAASAGHAGYQTFEVPPGGYTGSQQRQSSAGYHSYTNQGHGGYQSQGYQGGYQSQQASGGYQSHSGGGGGGYQNQSGGGYQGYSKPRGGGGYQNEHDDRINQNYRGRSNYSRGGRH